MPSVFRLAPKRFTKSIRPVDGGFVGIVRDMHKGRWWRTTLKYPTKDQANVAVKAAIEHLTKGQFDPTVEQFDGDI